MSTKTTFKRVALVAVASLGFGVLSSIAPASADSANLDVAVRQSVTLNTAVTSYAGRVGQQIAIDITGTTVAATLAAGDLATLSIAAAITSQPATSAVYPTIRGAASAIGTALTLAKGGNTLAGAATNAATILDAGTSSHTAVMNYVGVTSTPVNPTAVTGDDLGSLIFTPTVIGTYTLTVWNESSRAIGAATGTGQAGMTMSAEPALSGSESYQTFTVTVSAGVASITSTVINATAAKSAGADGAEATFGALGSLVKVTIKDAAGLPAALAPGESVIVDPSGTGDVSNVNNTVVASVVGAPYALTNADFTAGVAYVNIANATAEITYTTFTSGAVSNIATSTFVATENVTGEWTVAPTALSTGWVANVAPAIQVPAVSSVSYSVSAATATFLATEYASVRFFDEDGSITGLAGAAFDRAVLAGGTFTIAVTDTTVANLYELSSATVESDNAKNGLLLIATVAARDVAAAGVTVSPANARVAVAGSTSLLVTVKDQFGVAYANGRVTFSLAGRNGLQAAQSGTTNATGQVTFTVTDTALATSTLTSDTVTITAFDENSNASPTAAPVITWSSVGVGTVKLDSDNTTAGVAKTTAIVSAGLIQAGLAGPSAAAGLKTVSATITDTALLPMIGQACTWTVAGTGAAILSTTATTYTSALGVCTTSVYAWIAGTYTITATSGGISGTATQTFHNATATSVRSISATTVGNIVTAVVKDRFGNGVAGVTVYAIATGGANIGGSFLVSTPVTDLTGSVSWVVSGSGSVKLTTINPTGTGLALDQSTAAAGNHVGDVLLPVVFTATTVGTAATAETGVGASFSAAGVSSATVSVEADNSAANAADAAAEATDAANAATDAANAAAEAADAATAAAQDAADAVAALSTQVSEMVNALKKQITALTNLVIKIQKKVKA
jgi:trimeric autotransporter adhesin